MDPIKDITQNEIGEVIDNPVDQAGNKIKLRSVSHKNLLKHLINIPYGVKKGPEIKSSKVEKTEEQKEWNLTPKQYMDYIDTGRKPINVKETMLENIKKHSEMAEVVEKEEEQPVVEVTVEPEMTNVVEEPVVESTPEVEVTAPVQEEVKEETTVEVNEVESEVTNDVVNEDVQLPNEINIDQNYEEINNFRQQILSKKEEAEKAQKEAADSDKEVQDLGVQYTEAQKQLQDAKARNEEMKQKLVNALKNQTEILANATKQYDSVIEEANRRKEANQNIIVEMQPKISSAQEEIMTINNDTARIEEYFNAISSNNIIDFPQENNYEEEKVRRIA